MNTDFGLLNEQQTTFIHDKIKNCSVEKLGECDSTLTIKGIGQHLEGGFFEKIGGFAGQQG